MNANKMLLHSYSAAFHAALLHITKSISKHVRSATCVKAEEIAQRYTKCKKKSQAQLGNDLVEADSITYDCYAKMSFVLGCENPTCVGWLDQQH